MSQKELLNFAAEPFQIKQKAKPPALVKSEGPGGCTNS
jgi:hypothetical protein